MSSGTEEGDPTYHGGREFTVKELALVREVVESCSGLSRTELARTLCELLGWKRAAGGLKAQECREFLERLEAAGALALPDRAQLTEQGFNEYTTNQNESLGDAFWNVVGTPGLAGFVYHRMVDHPLEAASGLKFGL